MAKTDDHGCNPSEMLIQAANALNRVRAAGRFHVDATVDLTVKTVADTIHAHPTLSRVVEAAFQDALA